MLNRPVDASEHGFRVIDVCDAGPLVFASSHSGRAYPDGLMARSRLGIAALRKGEDRYVDMLLGKVVAPVLIADVARAYVDLNRDPGELDPDMFDPAPALPRASDRVRAGLGVIPRAFAAGQAIYSAKLPLAESTARIAAVHAPYHAALARLLERARARHGHAVLIDCHSMPSHPDCAPIVLGDLNGRSCAPEIAEAAATELAGLGLRVARNVPYAGAYTLERHGRPHLGIHALQIEFDRALYLDRAHLHLAPGAAALADRIGHFARALSVRFAHLAPPPFAIAAE